jgi:Tol biopolymer transport system component
VRFPSYTAFEPAIPVVCVTPDVSGAIHRFHDTSPFSPSGRYLAMTRLPVEDRLPPPGCIADVLVADLVTGEIRKVAETRGWDTQLGAQVQWGADDQSLYFNDVDLDEWIPYGVRLDPQSGARRRLAGTIYNLSPDGATSASPCLRRTQRVQAGYGVIVPDEHLPRNQGAPHDDGLYLTDTTTGATRLLVSLAEVVKATFSSDERARFSAGSFYGFHAKWNPQGTRLMFILRWIPPIDGQPRFRNVITMDANGGNIRRPITHRHWSRGGNHPNWCPDGEHLLMNLNLYGTGSLLVSVRYNGTNLRPMNNTLVGTGHPTLHPDGIHVLTDDYREPPVGFGDGTTPIRWLNLADTTETRLVRIRTRAGFSGPHNELRVDCHPAWDSAFRRFAFNGCPTGTRQVFVADMAGLVGAD